jgi:ABC-type uncharacterized transport system substrate-binding protein
MKRRDFMALVGAAAAWSRGVVAQSGQIRVKRVGCLFPGESKDTEASLLVFKQELARLGWKEGDTLELDTRWSAPDPARMTPVARDLVSRKPHAMYAVGTTAASALRDATQTIPIAFVGVTDPVGQGLVASLARPGGNLTGYTNFEFSIGGKWVELAQAVAPRIRRIAYIFNPNTAPYTELFMPAIVAASASHTLDLTWIQVRDENEIEQMVTAFGREPHGAALIVGADIFTALHRERIALLAVQSGLPTIYPWKEGAAAGGLVSYGTNGPDLARHGAGYLDRILRGARPNDLPVEQPNKFELVINLKTANALGLTVPPALLARADEVIE